MDPDPDVDDEKEKEFEFPPLPPQQFMDIREQKVVTVKLMGYSPDYIQRAFTQYEKDHGYENYNVGVITDIIEEMQTKDKLKGKSSKQSKVIKYSKSKPEPKPSSIYEATIDIISLNKKRTSQLISYYKVDKAALKQIKKWDGILNEWDKYQPTKKNPKKSKKLKKEIRKGIPHQSRANAWKSILGIGNELTKAQVTAAQTFYNDTTKIRDDSPAIKFKSAIDKDLGAGGSFSKQRQKGWLRNILCALANHYPEAGYVQEVGFIASMLLGVLTEEDTFWCLCQLFDKHSSDEKDEKDETDKNEDYGMSDLYLAGSDTLSMRYYQFNELMRKFMPKVHERINGLGINPALYASKWFIRLFCFDEFPIDAVYRIWDIYLSEGKKAIFRVSLALIKTNETKILKIKEFEPMINFLQNIHNEDNFNIDVLLKQAFNFNLKTAHLVGYAEKYEQQKRVESMSENKDDDGDDDDDEEKIDDKKEAPEVNKRLNLLPVQPFNIINGYDTANESAQSGSSGSDSGSSSEFMYYDYSHTDLLLDGNGQTVGFTPGSPGSDDNTNGQMIDIASPGSNRKKIITYERDQRIVRAYVLRNCADDDMARCMMVGNIIVLIITFYHTEPIDDDDEKTIDDAKDEKKIDDANDGNQLLDDPAKTMAALYVFGDGQHGKLGNRKKWCKKPTICPPFDCLEVAAGPNHSLMINDEGVVYVCGYGKDGALGNDSNKNVRKWKQIQIAVKNKKNEVLKLLKAKSIAAGCTHSIILTENGLVYMCGRNVYGQFGVKAEVTWFVPKPIHSLQKQKIVQIAAGDNHSMVLTAEGILLAFGRNGKGQCGVGKRKENNIRKPTPVQLPNGAGVEDFSCGANHSLIVVKKDGVIYSCGDHYFGQCGHDDDDDDDDDDAKTKTEKMYPSPTAIDNTQEFNGKAIKKCAGGKDHSICVDVDGGVWTWGRSDNFGALGLRDEQPTKFCFPQFVEYFDEKKIEAKDCMAGGNGSAVLSVDNELYVFGQNFKWQLGMNNAPFIDEDIEGIERKVYSDTHMQTIAEPIKLYTLPENSSVLKVSMGGDHTLLIAEGFVEN